MWYNQGPENFEAAMIHKSDDGNPVYLFDMSRLECARKCPREYYWRYGFLGIGIVRKVDIPPYWPYLTGTFIHEGIENILLHGMTGKAAADKAYADYAALVRPIINSPDLQPEQSALLNLDLDQQLDLVQALVYGWYLASYPTLTENYTLVEDGIEHEESICWEVDGSLMVLMTRTDLLCKSKATNGAMLFNLKSTSNPDMKWRNSFNRDMQTLTEAIAVEDRLKIKVEGVVIEGLVKGTRNEYPKGSGFYQHNNMLIYSWVKDSTDVSLPGEEGGMEFAYEYEWTCTEAHIMGNNKRCPGGKQHKLGQGYRKRLVRDVFPGGVYGWIDHLVRVAPHVLSSYFVRLEPIQRDEFQVERWKRMNLPQEKIRQDAANSVDNYFIANDKNSAFQVLDNSFPMHEGYQCFDCSYQDICWFNADPFDETKWKPRVPNHLMEAKMLTPEGEEV